MSKTSRLMWLWTAGVLAGIALLAVAAVAYTAVALPGCGSCHKKKAFIAATAASPHASVKCADCHVPRSVTGRVTFATREVFHMVVPVVSDLDRSYAAVPRQRCLSCHGDQITKSGVVGSRGLRILHEKCTAGQQCSNCHSTTAHGTATRWPRTPQMEDCYRCHGQSNKKTKCDTCHAERPERQRVFDGPFRVTHGPEWKNTHGMGDMKSCVACHDEKKCGKCHGVGVPHEGEFLQTHASYSTSKQAKCFTCHRKQFCADCHAYPMPHSEKFTLNHAKTVAKDGKKRCLTCHAQSDCDQCHIDHVHPVTKEQINGFMLKGSRLSGGTQ